jgi:hypothetical protein
MELVMIETISDYKEEVTKFRNELEDGRELLFRGQSNHIWYIRSS